MQKDTKWLIIIPLIVGLIVLNIFLPHMVVNLFPKSSKMEIGISYWYNQQQNWDIAMDLKKIKEDGFTTIRIKMEYDLANPDALIINQTNKVIEVAHEQGLKVAVIVGVEDMDYLETFINRYGYGITYYQILNEPELAKPILNLVDPSSMAGALYIDNELYWTIDQIFTRIHVLVPNATTYTNFSPAFIFRTNLVDFYRNYTNFIGYDTYTTGVIEVTPYLVSILKSIIKDKRLIISEFGIMEDNDEAQATHIIDNLNFFKNMGFNECWICYWTSGIKGYNIAGRLAEEKVVE